MSDWGGVVLTSYDPYPGKSCDSYFFRVDPGGVHIQLDLSSCSYKVGFDMLLFLAILFSLLSLSNSVVDVVVVVVVFQGGKIDSFFW
jgi:hypothetical protein